MEYPGPVGRVAPHRPGHRGHRSRSADSSLPKNLARCTDSNLSLDQPRNAVPSIEVAKDTERCSSRSSCSGCPKAGFSRASSVSVSAIVVVVVAAATEPCSANCCSLNRRPISLVRLSFGSDPEISKFSHCALFWRIALHRFKARERRCRPRSRGCRRGGASRGGTTAQWLPGQNDHDPSRENRPRHSHGGARSTPLVCCVVSAVTSTSRK